MYHARPPQHLQDSRGRLHAAIMDDIQGGSSERHYGCLATSRRLSVAVSAIAKSAPCSMSSYMSALALRGLHATSRPEACD